MSDINNIKFEPHFKFSFGKKQKATKFKRVGILINKGKSNSIIDNTFQGLDVGIEDRGEKTKVKGNKFS